MMITTKHLLLIQIFFGLIDIATKTAIPSADPKTNSAIPTTFSLHEKPRSSKARIELLSIQIGSGNGITKNTIAYVKNTGRIKVRISMTEHQSKSRLSSETTTTFLI